MHSGDGSTALQRGFQLALNIEGLQPSTIFHYTRDVRWFCATLGSRDIRNVDATAIRTYLEAFRQTHRPKTVREAQLALRRFFRWLVTEGEMEADPTRDIRLTAFKVEPQPTYSKTEVKRLVLCCSGKSLLGARDRALILTLWDTGVRAGELVSMTEVHWERENVQVSGKTGTRSVPLGQAALQALDRYTRRWVIEGPPLWRGERGALTESGVLQAVQRLCGQAGIEHKGVHAFRRAAAAQMKRLGMQDSDILEILGWKSVTMLRRYTAAVAEELAQKAHRSYSPADHLGR